MGGRGTFASDNNVAYTYETVGNIEGVKVLYGKPGTGIHDLPAEAHSSVSSSGILRNMNSIVSFLCSYVICIFLLYRIPAKDTRKILDSNLTHF